MQKRFFILSLILLIVCCISGCSTEQQTQGQEDIITFALNTEPASLDPAMTYGLPESTTELALFEGLTRLDANHKPQPALADSWTISLDGKTYTFHLREGICWSDGTHITAQDFAYSWLRALKPETGCGNAYMLFPIAKAEEYNNGEAAAEDVGIKVLDSRTLQVTLKDPASYFLDLTAFHVFYPVPEHLVREKPDTWASDAQTLLGCGPYKIEKWVHSSEIRLVKNEHYWNKEQVKTPKLRMIISESPSTRLTMLESGLADMMLDPPGADQKRLEELGIYQIEPMLGTFYYVFNVTKAPFDKKEIRQAFALALERDDLVHNVIRNGKEPAYAFVPPGMYVQGQDFRQFKPHLWSEEPTKAKELLQTAGYQDMPISILYNTNESIKAITEATQALWLNNLGVQVELVNQEAKVFYASREDGDYQVAVANWIADFADPINFLEVFADTANDAQYHNPDYEQLIASIRQELNPTRRIQLMHQAEQMLLDDCVIIPIYYSNQIMVLNPQLKGYICSPMGTVDFIQAYKEIK